MARRGDAAGICVAAAAARLAFARAVTLLATLAVMQLVCSGSVRAQTQEQEADRIPGIPEESIAVNFPRDFGDPGGVRSALAGRGVTYGINYLGDVLGNPVGGFEQGTRYMGRLEFAACRRHGESRSAGRASPSSPTAIRSMAQSISALEPWRPDAGELHRGDAVDAAIRAVAGAEAASAITSRSASGSSRRTRSSSSARAPARFSTARGAGRRSSASTCRMAARPIRWRRPRARLAFNPNDNARLPHRRLQRRPSERLREICPQVCNPHGLDFPFSEPLLLYEGAIKYNQDEGELAGHVEARARGVSSAVSCSRASATTVCPSVSCRCPACSRRTIYGFYAILDQMIYRLPGERRSEGRLRVRSLS